MKFSKLIGGLCAVAVAASSFMALAVTASAAVNGTAIESGSVTLSDGNYYLSADTTASITVPSGVTATLDLCGYTLTNVSGSATITNAGTLTIKDGGSTGTVTNVTSGESNAAVYNTGTATLYGGTFKRGDGSVWYTIWTGGTGTLTIDGATVENYDDTSAAIENDGDDTHQNTSKLYIISGTVISDTIAVKNDDDGLLVITGGTITSTSSYAVYNYNMAQINDGTISGAYAVATDGGKGKDSGCAGTTSIYGGTITATNRAVYVTNGGTTTINDGTITASGGEGIAVYSDDDVDIKGGTITGSSYGVYSQAGTADIKGGTITGSTAGVVASGGTVTISGDDTKITGDNYGLYVADSGTATVKGGTIDGSLDVYSGGTTTVSGGEVGTLSGNVTYASSDDTYTAMYKYTGTASELNGKTIKIQFDKDGSTGYGTITPETYVSGDMDVEYDLVITDIPSDVTVASVTAE